MHRWRVWKRSNVSNHAYYNYNKRYVQKLENLAAANGEIDNFATETGQKWKSRVFIPRKTVRFSLTGGDYAKVPRTPCTYKARRWKRFFFGPKAPGKLSFAKNLPGKRRAFVTSAGEHKDVLRSRNQKLNTPLIMQYSAAFDARRKSRRWSGALERFEREFPPFDYSLRTQRGA